MIAADANMDACILQVRASLGKNRARFKTPSLGFALTAVFSLFSSASIAAQSIAPEDVILFRERSVSDYLPVGIRAGGFLLSPGIGITTTYDDNIFRTPNNEQSDVITNISPAFAAQSNWSRHSIFFGVEGDIGLYADNTDENFEDYAMILSGQYDFTEDTYLIAAISRAKRHISRGALFDPNATAPSEYEVDRQQLRFVRELGRLQLELNAQNEDVELSDINATGVPITSFTTRDGQKLGGELRYEYMPDNALFTGITFDKANYTITGGARRDADGYDAQGGWRFDNNRSLSGSIYATHINRDYSAGLGGTQKTYPGFNINWDLTGLTTLNVRLDTSFNETTVAGAAGIIRTTRRAVLAHQLTNRLRLEASGGKNDFEFVGGLGAINRTTDVRYAGGGFFFRINQHTGLRGRYEFQKRDSQVATDRYTDNRASLSLTYMY